jgi:aldehyde:ferredoxin oxidoreductase
MRPEEDFLPEYFFTHPLQKRLFVLDKEEFNRMLKEYYELRGFKNHSQ